MADPTLLIEPEDDDAQTMLTLGSEHSAVTDQAPLLETVPNQGSKEANDAEAPDRDE